MDPKANIEETRAIRRRIYHKTAIKGDYARLRELQEAKRAWLAAGGFWPEVPRFNAGRP